MSVNCATITVTYGREKEGFAEFGKTGLYYVYEGNIPGRGGENTTLILFSILCFLLSAWRYRALHVNLRQLDITMVPMSIIVTVNLLFSLCAILAVVGLWIVIGTKY